MIGQVTDTYFRETWGLSRLWCIPAVVAYVVCMYRIRARLFATTVVLNNNMNSVPWSSSSQGPLVCGTRLHGTVTVHCNRATPGSRASTAQTFGSWINIARPCATPMTHVPLRPARMLGNADSWVRERGVESPARGPTHEDMRGGAAWVSNPIPLA